MPKAYWQRRVDSSGCGVRRWSTSITTGLAYLASGNQVLISTASPLELSLVFLSSRSCWRTAGSPFLATVEWAGSPSCLDNKRFIMPLAASVFGPSKDRGYPFLWTAKDESISPVLFLYYGASCRWFLQSFSSALLHFTSLEFQFNYKFLKLILELEERAVCCHFHLFFLLCMLVLISLCALIKLSKSNLSL